MRISAEFVTSAARYEQLPKEQLPEIALVGRSNVGKSSLINTLVGKAGLARTSNTPGRTQTLNYYRVTLPEKGNRSFFLVDMPGYGFASINQASRNNWMNLIEQYLSTRETLCGTIQLVDFRHPPQPLDHNMFKWLDDNDQNYLIVGTKADKVAKTKVSELLLQIAEKLNVDSINTMAFSAETGFGRDKLLGWILETTDVKY